MSAILWTSAVDRVGVVSVVSAVFSPVVSVILSLGSVLEEWPSDIVTATEGKIALELESGLEFQRAS